MGVFELEVAQISLDSSLIDINSLVGHTFVNGGAVESVFPVGEEAKYQVLAIKLLHEVVPARMRHELS